MNKQFGDGFDQLTDTSHIESLKLNNSATGEQLSIDNIPGKQASVKILYGIACDNNFKISVKQAALGLKLYGDYTQEELDNPGSHPNIKLLIDTIANNYEWAVASS